MNYEVPVFSQQTAEPARKAGRPRTVSDSVVAGIRWDYEQALMSNRAIAIKYGMKEGTVWDIAHYNTHRGIAADKAASELNSIDKEGTA